MAEKTNAEALLIIIRNLDDNILKEVNRLTKSYLVYTKLANKYGNGNDDTEYWLKKLKNIKAKDITQISKTVEDIRNIFQEMKDSEIEITERERLKYMYNALPTQFRNTLDITLNTKSEELYNMVINRINAKSYLENWENDKPEPEDLMEIDFVHRGRNSNKHRRYTNQIKRPYCHICTEQGHWTDECEYNSKSKQNKQNKHNKQNRQAGKNKNNRRQGRQYQRNTNKKELGLVEYYSVKNGRFILS